jgi:benzoate-CoA ligase family protein
MRAMSLSLPNPFNAAVHFVDRHVAEGRGARIAIECGDERVSYQQLFERVNRVGTALRDRLGVRPEERVLLLLTDTPAFAYAFFGSVKIGAVPVPLNTLWKPPDYAHVLRDTRARVLFVTDSLLPHIAALPANERQSLEHIIVVGQAAGGLRPFDELVQEGSTALEPYPTSPDDTVVWLYSSGSTGRPKACIHLHHDLVVTTEAFAKGVLGLTENDRCYSASKLFFAYGLGNGLYMPFGVGATSILSPATPNAATVYSVIERYRPTLFYWVPTGYAMLLAHRRDNETDFDLSSVRCALSAGEALPPALFERFMARFGIEILDGIGATETMHNVISNRPGTLRVGSTGVLVPGYEARLLDDAGRPVATGEIGNLYIKGDSICAGYWNQHEKTKSAIEGHWFRTGDRFSQDADGFFWFAGRADDMLKVGGMWVSPIEVEQTLVEHPAVHECAVTGREDGDRLMKPCAFVVPAANVSADSLLASELQAYVGERLPGYKRPRWIEFVPELPKTPTGKIQRFKLRE